ncbi:DUF3667 domain-containing protein [Flagellimonas pelagia]|uniref:DUF3667 domain-containing protein n=1 Tax=Flagellimonas pelagia TaxID=2306998 RepID=A0A3A1NR84_9FLAO|nr:DUF3667 domain-containing protein [Allomuricauda maritima]RIV47201.1 DUF3667 domain-containing protein [Allomuricauda maritima]TXK00902.1 DUF3667 domain-containing protein [Allomuricauda maritima]
MGKKDGLVSKGRYQLQFRGVTCLNCGHPLDISDKYCPNCSQANSTKKLTLKDFLDEFLSSVMNYDSKLLKTLSALIMRPGGITMDYINGKRVSYTNPFRFLLSLAFIYFLMFTFNNQFSDLDKAAKSFDGNITAGGPVSYNIKSGDIKVDSLKMKQQAEEVLKSLDSIDKKNPGLALGLKKFDSIRNADPEVAHSLSMLDSLTHLKDQKPKVNKDSLMAANPKIYFDSISKKSGIDGFSDKVDFFVQMIKKDTLFSFEQASEKYNIEGTMSNKMAFNASNNFLTIIQRPSAFIKSTISKLPFVIFFFMPLFTIFIWLVYIRKKYTYTDHLIFSFHNQSLLFILLILSLILDTIFKISTAWLFVTIFSIYLFMAMKKFYGQGVFKTIVKYIFLNTIFTILAFFAVLVLFTGSVFIYN